VLRRIAAALVLLTPSALMAQADKDAIVITGVVDGIGGGGASQKQGEKTWTGSVHLVAWRVTGPKGEGPISTETLRVEIPDQRDSDLAKWEAVFPPRTLVRFAIREPLREENGRKLAILRAPLPRTYDAALIAAADPVLNPPPLVDPEFGTFIPDRQFPEWLRLRRDWLGREINVTLRLDYEGPPASDARQRALTHLRSVWERRAEWDARLRETIAAEYYDVWRDSWRDEDEPEIDRETFKARFVLEDASISPGGSLAFTFADDDLFWGHAMAVHYDPETGDLYAEMFG
jgi:hypothetical protein